MKTLKSKFIGFLVLLSIFVISSCVDDDYNTPPINIPKANLVANKTIAELKASYAGVLDSIEQEWIIKGIVVANDESGNFYKTLQIQDSTAGIELKLDRSYLNTYFKVGQLIYIKCKGLFLGTYGGLIQLGYKYNNDIGRIPDVMIDNHIFRDGLPVTPPEPFILTIPDLATVGQSKLSMLVRFNNVSFVEAGQPFSLTTGSTNRNIKDQSGNTIILRTSNYANFASSTMPTGNGGIVGILSKYNNDWQLYIRDLTDLKNWQVDNSLEIFKETFATDLGQFFQFSVHGDQMWAQSTASGKTFAKMTGFVSSVGYPNEDWLIMSNPINMDNYKKEIMKFETAMRYGLTTEQTFTLLWSNNYPGSGDPTSATWNELAIPSLPPGTNWTFVPSGDISLSGVSGTNVYFAFKYTCGNTNVPTWEVTNIVIKGETMK